MKEINQQYERDGFVAVPHLFSREEVASFKTEIQRVLAEVRAEAGAAGQGDGDILRAGVFVGLAPRSEMFRRLAADPRLLDVLEQVMGPDIEFLSDKVVYKDAQVSFPSPWHQDWPYWGGSHKVSVWVALDDATPENGCMKLIAGSHHHAVSHDGDAGDGRGFGNRLDPSQVDESKAVTAPLEAGGALFFHDLTLHASHEATGTGERWVWLPTYRSPLHNDPPYEWAAAAHVVRSAA